MFKKILVPVDGSDSSAVAAKVALDVAVKNNGALTFLHVVRPYIVKYDVEGSQSLETEIPPGATEFGQKVLNKIKESYTSPDLVIETKLATGNPAQVICSEASEGNYDLIIMGSRGIGGVVGSLIGSVSQGVSHMANCPVLLTKLNK